MIGAKESILRRQEMPLHGMLEVELFDVFGIDIMGPFLSSNNNLYILVVFDYISKWVEAQILSTNDTKAITRFLKKNIYIRFGTPRAIISDKGSHFCDKGPHIWKQAFSTLLSKYGVKCKVATTHPPQTSRKTEISNREIKRILRKVVSPSRNDWPLKLDDALLA